VKIADSVGSVYKEITKITASSMPTTRIGMQILKKNKKKQRDEQRAKILQVIGVPNVQYFMSQTIC
jgi:hypothetical protein